MRFKVSTIIFDMDGVITDTMPYHFQAWKSVLSQEGIAVSRQDIYQREGQKGVDSVRDIFKERAKMCTEKQGQRILRKKEALFKKIFKVKFIAGSRSFIKKAYTSGFRLALVTGTSRAEAQKLIPSSLWNYFEATICGCDVQNGKPHPEPYLKVLRQLNIRPSDAIVLENAPCGIVSALRAGMVCLALETSLDRRFLKKADAVFSSFKDLQSKVTFIKKSL